MMGLRNLDGMKEEDEGSKWGNTKAGPGAQATRRCPATCPWWNAVRMWRLAAITVWHLARRDGGGVAYLVSCCR